MEYAELVERHLGDSVQNGINSFGKPYKRSPLGQEMQKYRNRYTQLREMMGTHLDNLMAQICVYNSAISYATLFWSREEDKRNLFLADTTLSVKEREDKAADMVSITTMMPHLLPTFAHPYIHDRAEAYMNEVLDKTSLTIPLPENDDTAYKIFEYCMKYPDKYLFIDFWGMGCGPCRASIEQDMGQRASIASRDDVKVIYIAAEREPGGSQTYRDYVEKWMFDGEEVVCVTDEEFARFQELFQFSGIPHYELITPKCRRVRDDLQIRGFTSFELQFEELKEKLK
jgi:thiol-disulfide isomerase/thioredoxin